MMKRKLIIIITVIILIAIGVGVLWFSASKRTALVPNNIRCKDVGGEIVSRKGQFGVEFTSCLSKETFTDAGKKCSSSEECMSGSCYNPSGLGLDYYGTDGPIDLFCSDTKTLFWYYSDDPSTIYGAEE